MGAISEFKSHSDYLWLAGAYEGFAASILVAMQANASLEEVIGRDVKALTSTGLSTDSALLKIAEDRCAEALAIYSKNVAFSGLEVECLFRVARLCADYPVIPDREQKVLVVPSQHSDVFVNAPHLGIGLFAPRDICVGIESAAANGKRFRIGFSLQ